MIDPDAREDLASVLHKMKPGGRLMLRDVSYQTYWPNPPYPRQDDHLEPKDRAVLWLARFSCVSWETFDPPGLAIEKRPSPEQSLNSPAEKVGTSL